ncbi:hypothetical protein MUU72_13455 [Streptomyces sp. RS10V-4]|uniref:hypothetical protein n=1 Tax=Streptomyces rhizoryzae TaxID=2932493 RepID=UPI0020038E4D|nr:hypothetical protein [Streptomyces rhizoryzae]MCK7624093.1 hypothetical protein [Streptomyces rhizoryzae]
MACRLALLLLPLLRLLFPPTGRHRWAPKSCPAPPRYEGSPTMKLSVAHPPSGPPARTPARPPVLLRDEDPAFVRPYVLTADERRVRRAQRGRRRALWLAVHGVDVGPRRIHGVEVAA